MATHTAQIAPKTVLARFESKSKPGHFHEVRLGADAVMYCTCNSWRFQKASPSQRTCCHTEAAVQQITHGGATLRAQEQIACPKPAVRAKRTKKVTEVVIDESFWTRL